MRIAYLRSASLKVLATAPVWVWLGCQSGGGMRQAGMGGSGAGGSAVGDATTAGVGGGGWGGATGGSDGSAPTCQLDSACPDSGLEPADALCVPGSLVCQQDTNLLTCNVLGVWEVTRVCPGKCLNGGCRGDCANDETRCQVDKPVLQSCVAGVWINYQCPYQCREGACFGSCAPGSQSCSSSNYHSVRKCSDDATTWVEIEPCGGSTPTCFKGECVPECVLGGGVCTEQVHCCAGASACAQTGGIRYCRL